MAGPCRRVKIGKSETESKRSRINGSGAFANLPTPKQINRVVAVAFKKFIYIENRHVSECHGEAERCQRLVCLPFHSRRKGIQHGPCPRWRNEFVNKSASAARATQRLRTTSRAPGSRDSPSASHRLSCPRPPFLKVAWMTLNFPFEFVFPVRPRAGSWVFL